MATDIFTLPPKEDILTEEDVRNIIAEQLLRLDANQVRLGGGQVYQGFGALASASDVDFDSQVTGAEKPEDNATLGGTIGTDIKDEDNDVAGQDTIVNFKKFTAGENLVAGNVVCVKPSIVDDVHPSDDAYVYEFEPNTNFNSGGNVVRLRVGLATASRENITFIKFDMADVAPISAILKAELVLTTRQAISGPIDKKSVRRVTSADWTASGITWNNKPSVTNDIEIVYTDIGNIGGSAEFLPASIGNQKAIDITQLVKNWKDGTIDNFGLTIERISLNELDFDSDETDNADSTRPILRITKLNVSDGKAYKANADSYNLSRAVVGIVQETITSGNIGKIQVQGRVSTITGVGGITAGRISLGLSAGGGDVDGVTLDRYVGIAKAFSATDFLLSIQDKDIFIEDILKNVAHTDIGSGQTRRYYIHSDVRYVIIRWRNSSSAANPQSILRVNRDNIAMPEVDYYSNDDVGSVEMRVKIIGNFLELQNRGSGTARVLNILLYT